MSEDPIEDESVLAEIPSPNFDVEADAQSSPPPVKRKGGRKPVYATLEERKQRNRQAQAAFRERRTEYIKQLEVAMKENETTLEQLQQSNRETVEECHMLRYKTSLLEDLLYENGIDYQSELQTRSAKSLLASPFSTQGTSRGQWNQSSNLDLQPDKRTKSTQWPQKIKPKAKSPNAQMSSPHQPPVNYVQSHPAAHRMGGISMALEPITPLQPSFDHSNGDIHSMHHSFYRHGQHFDDGHGIPAMSPHEAPAPYYSPEGHMANYLGK